ncbi:MAG TPA: PASTA domain-containing protein [Patescibacteria group bacterium]|nr:PASTA domain-containing protein [Patescibacteria group bacterium]
MTNSGQGHENTGVTPRQSRATRLLVRLGWVAILSGVLVILFAGSFYMMMRMAFTRREVAVPELTGLPVEDARATLARSGLFLEQAAERFDDKVVRGRVLSQDPRAGATTKRDRKVRVTVSLGVAEVSIPEVQGQSVRTAQIAIQGSGLGVGHVTSVHDTRTISDVVMAQHPDRATGTSGLQLVGGQARIDLLVSRGRPDPVYVMPDLSRHTLNEVKAFAQRAGLRLGAVRREPAPGVRPGSVIRQSPEAGYPVGRQDIISLVLGDQ